MLTAISVLDIINTFLGGLVVIMLVALLMRLHMTATIREEIHHIVDELHALQLRMSVHEQTSPCEHCRRAHGGDQDHRHGE